MATDYYVVLQVTRGATAEEIRSAYRRRALELHPDRSGADSDPFLELQRAYAVLSDPTQRAAYDRGAESVPIWRGQGRGSRRRAAEPFREVEPTGSFRDISFSRSFDRFAPSFEEIFERWWSNFDLLDRPKEEQLESLTMDVPLSAEEALAGGRVRIMVPSRIACPTCHGHGGIGFYECWRCRGQGAVAAEYPLEVGYPAGLRRDYVVRVPLDDFGIRNFYFTIRFRPSDMS